MHQNGVVDIHSAAKFATDFPASNTAAVVTITADVGQYWLVDLIAWSYSGAPTGGRLTIAIGGTTVFDVDIAAAGPDLLVFTDAPWYKQAQTLNQAMVITLAAGGSGVTGKLNVRYR